MHKLRHLQFERLEKRELLSYGLTEVAIKNEPSEWPAYLGFYKDLFIDGGAYLTSKPLYVSDHMWLSVDNLLTSSTTKQNNTIIGTPSDTNGVLLFPDGQPRYRAVFVNGGSATKHGKSLGIEGRARFETFVTNGGSFVGSCAGAYLASSKFSWYFNLVPIELEYSGYLSTEHSVVFENKNEFTQIFDELSGKNEVDNIKHYGGPYFVAGVPEIEYFGRIINTERKLKDSPYLLAYKRSEATGRVIVQPSHPEYAKDGLQFSLMQSIITYALRGTVLIPNLKGTLEINQSVNETVGDKQYHRWEVDIPKGKIVNITLNGNDSDLYVQFNYPANNESYLQTGDNISITGDGILNVSVFGNHVIPNGVDYNLTVVIISQGIILPVEQIKTVEQIKLIEQVKLVELVEPFKPIKIVSQI